MPLADRLALGMFGKADDIQTDADAAKSLGASKAAGLHQMHGKRTVIVRDSSARTEQADGMWTDARGLALCIRWADCQNFVAFSPSKNIAGVLHVGWRGLIAGAIPEFIAVAKTEWNADPSDLVIGASPSLCKRCADFSDPLHELSALDKRFINGKHADLRGAATEQFLAMGIRPDRFERHMNCTRCQPDLYWTYRGGHREEVQAGHTNMLACCLK